MQVYQHLRSASLVQNQGKICRLVVRMDEFINYSKLLKMGANSFNLFIRNLWRGIENLPKHHLDFGKRKG